MKRLYYFYIFLIFSITLIFLLYIKTPLLDANVKKTDEALVFYDDNNEIKGAYLDIENPIVDIFSYLTSRRNSLPLGAKTHSNGNTILDSYEIDDTTLSLDITLDEDISFQFFIPLLFESYYALGYQNLIIKTGDNMYTYDSLEVFKIASYDTYKVVNIDGRIRKNYQFDDNEIILEVLFTNEFNIYEILNDIDGISYELNDTLINVEIIDTTNKSLILHLLKLNLKGLSYSFQAL